MSNVISLEPVGPEVTLAAHEPALRLREKRLDARRFRRRRHQGMTAKVIALKTPTRVGDRDALMAAVSDLHTLITIDPILGASPVRVYFVFKPESLKRIDACLDPSDPAARRAATGYALVAYDFPFALHLLQAAGSRIAIEKAKEIATCSAELQAQSLRAAAAALGIDARPARAFDGDALKALFFPNTQEEVIQLFQLDLRA